MEMQKQKTSSCKMVPKRCQAVKPAMLTWFALDLFHTKNPPTLFSVSDSASTLIAAGHLLGGQYASCISDSALPMPRTANRGHFVLTVMVWLLCALGSTTTSDRGVGTRPSLQAILGKNVFVKG